MIQPVRDHILIAIEKVQQEAKTNSGIILKTQAPQRRTIGKVVAIGQGRILENGQIAPIDVYIGDEVIFYDYAGVAINDSCLDASKDYLIIKQNDVIAIVSNEGSDAGGVI